MFAWLMFGSVGGYTKNAVLAAANKITDIKTFYASTISNVIISFWNLYKAVTLPTIRNIKFSTL